MKIIRNWVTLASFSVVVFALCAAGARAQSLRTTHFAGTFTLPFEAQWGRVALPAGEYRLAYGRLYEGGVKMVEIVGKENSTPHVLILTRGVTDTSAKKSALVCIREGDTVIVRVLEMPQIGESVDFAMPPGTKLMANRSDGKKNALMAEGPKLLQRIPITLASK